MISILLADDHTLVRQGLRLVLQNELDMSVVGDAASGPEAIEQAAALKPRVLLLDLGLPGLHGLEVARQVAKRAPSTRVIVLSMHSNDEYVIGAFQNGAAGYLLKGCDAAELVSAIRRVAAGGRYVSPELSEQVLGAMMDRSSGEATDPYGTLTAREREVFQLMAEGKTNHQVAEALFISGRTVETHRANVLRKLGLHSQSDVVRYAMQRGLING